MAPRPHQPRCSTTRWPLTCNAPSGDASKVTAVAVVPYSQSPNPGPTPVPQLGAGDAHRVVPFVIAPNSVVISPASVSQSTNDCQLFPAQILDSSGSNLSGKRIDVHATGPGNDTFFAAVSGKTDSFTSPSNPQAHSNYETAASCDKNNHSSGGGKQPAGPGQS